MKKSKNYQHKNTKELITAIQYIGDKNKYNVCELLKGKKFQVEFARSEKAPMKIALGEDDFFDLPEKDWLFKDAQGNTGVCSADAFKEYYQPIKTSDTNKESI